ncbi:unnamed protein product [Musa banksii]
MNAAVCAAISPSPHHSSFLTSAAALRSISAFVSSILLSSSPLSASSTDGIIAVSIALATSSGRRKTTLPQTITAPNSSSDRATSTPRSPPDASLQIRTNSE